MPLLAKGDVAVHKLLATQGGDEIATETVILSEGEFLLEEEVPAYVLEGVKAGTAPGLEKVTLSVAEKAAAAAQVKAEAQPEVNASNADEDADEA